MTILNLRIGPPKYVDIHSGLALWYKLNVGFTPEVYWLRPKFSAMLYLNKALKTEDSWKTSIHKCLLEIASRRAP